MAQELQSAAQGTISSQARKHAARALDAVTDAVEAHAQRLGIEGDHEIKVWHLLASLHEYCGIYAVDLPQQFADVRRQIDAGEIPSPEWTEWYGHTDSQLAGSVQEEAKATVGRLNYFIADNAATPQIGVFEDGEDDAIVVATWELPKGEEDRDSLELLVIGAVEAANQGPTASLADRLARGAAHCATRQAGAMTPIQQMVHDGLIAAAAKSDRKLVSACEVAAQKGNIGGDSCTTLATLNVDGTDFDLRVCGTGSEAYFEWINDGGDPVGDIFDEMEDVDAEKQRFRSVVDLKPVGRIEQGFVLAARRVASHSLELISFHPSQAGAVQVLNESSDARSLFVVPATVRFAENGNVRLWRALGEPVAERKLVVEYRPNNVGCKTTCRCGEQFKPHISEAAECPFDVKTGAPVCDECASAAAQKLGNGDIVVAQRRYAFIADIGEEGVVVDALSSAADLKPGTRFLVATRGYVAIDEGDAAPTGRTIVGATFDKCERARLAGTLAQALVDGKLPIKPRTYGDDQALMVLAAARMGLSPCLVDEAAKQLQGKPLHPMTGAAISQEACRMNDLLRHDASQIEQANAHVKELMVEYGFAESSAA